VVVLWEARAVVVVVERKRKMVRKAVVWRILVGAKIPRRQHD